MPTSLLSVFAFSFAMTFGAAASPGPVSTAIVSQSPRSGWLVGPMVSTGHSLVELVMMGLIGFGLSSLLGTPVIQTAIAILGGLLLIWMGVDMLLATWRGKVHLPGRDENSKAMSRRQLFSLGIMTTLVNPFWYAWWVTVVPGYLLQVKAMGAASIAAFYLGHISVDYAWNTLLSTVVGGGRRWMTDKIYQVINGACGVFLIYLGVVFLVNGLG